MRRTLSRTRSILALVLTAASSFPLFAQQSGPEPSTAAELYTTLASLPLAQRKIIYRSLTPAAKAAAWKEHLRSFGIGNSLSHEQEAVIADALSTLNVQQFEAAGVDQPSSDTRAALRELEARARRAFPKELLIAAFGTLGPVEKLPKPQEADAAIESGHMRVLRIEPNPIRECDCTRESDFCVGSCGGGICYATQGGCGWWWQYDCSAVCNGW